MKLIKFVHARMRAGFPRQEDLASAAGVRRETINRIENKSRHRTKMLTIYKVAKPLGVRPTTLARWILEED